MPGAKEELVKDIAATHGIAIGRDDPIMIFHTMNARLAEDNAKAQQEMLDRFKQELEALSARWSSDAKERAERILSAAMDASKSTMREAAREVAASVRVEVDAAVSRVDAALRQASVVAIMNVVAACVALFVVLAWAGWR